MITMHDCPAPECGTRVSAERLACPPHWYQLPREMRAEIWAALRARSADPTRHRRAVAAALAFWRAGQ